MKINPLIIILLSTGLLSTPAESHWIGDCWDTWSRCSQWSSFATGILWHSCDERCKQLKRSGGNCVLSPTNCPIVSNKTYQCQCYQNSQSQACSMVTRLS
ncbi:hypothetical protein Btru_074669 [Bulinus truncatus]|nr:hypothetical protein Btru_074669 [Bulinus truncatus]